jgi:hypothetical protein
VASLFFRSQPAPEPIQPPLALPPPQVIEIPEAIRDKTPTEKAREILARSGQQLEAGARAAARAEKILSRRREAVAVVSQLPVPPQQALQEEEANIANLPTLGNLLDNARDVMLPRLEDKQALSDRVLPTGVYWTGLVHPNSFDNLDFLATRRFIRQIENFQQFGMVIVLSYSVKAEVADRQFKLLEEIKRTAPRGSEEQISARETLRGTTRKGITFSPSWLEGRRAAASEAEAAVNPPGLGIESVVSGVRTTWSDMWTDDIGEEMDFNEPITLSLFPLQKRAGALYTECQAIQEFGATIDGYNLLQVLQILSPKSSGPEPNLELPCLIQALYFAAKTQYDNLTDIWGETFEEATNKIYKACARHMSLGTVQTNRLTQIADKLEVRIKMNKYNTSGAETFGHDGPILRIALHAGHFFVYHKFDKEEGKGSNFGLPKVKYIKSTVHLMALLPESDYTLPLSYEDKDKRVLEVKEVPKISIITRDMVPDGDTDTEHRIINTLNNGQLEEKVKANKEFLEGIELQHHDDVMSQDEDKDKLSQWTPGLVEFVVDTETAPGPEAEVLGYSCSLSMFIDNTLYRNRTATFFTMSNRGTGLECCIDDVRMKALAHARRSLTAFCSKYKINCSPVEMIKTIRRRYRRHPFKIWAHNLKFDFAQLFREKKCLKVHSILGTVGSMRGASIDWGTLEDNMRIDWRDSASLIPAKLADFGKMFNLDISKAAFPYTYFNLERTTRHVLNNWEDAEEVAYSVIRPHLKPGELPEFEKAVTDADCWIGKDHIDLKEYVRYYNELDVNVTAEGIIAFRKIFKDEFGVDVSNACTVGGAAHTLVTQMGCYDHVATLTKELSEFTRTGIRGGYVARRNDECQIVFKGARYDPHFEEAWRDRRTAQRVASEMVKEYRRQDALPPAETEVEYLYDCDVNSLYPTCQSSLPGGEPIYIELDRVMKFINREWLYTTIEIRSMPEVDISFIPYKNKAGKRRFARKMDPGAAPIRLRGFKKTRDVLDKMGLKLNEHYFITSAVLYPHTVECLGELTNYLYILRRRAEALGLTALAAVVKLILNNIWGKCGQRTYNDDDLFFKDNEAAWKYMEANMEVVKSFAELATGTVVRRNKSVLPEYESMAQVAVAVTDRAKEVIYDYIRALEDSGCHFMYTDTDSAHVQGTDTKLEAAWELYAQRHGSHPSEKKELTLDDGLSAEQIAEIKKERPDKLFYGVLGGMKSDFDVKPILDKGDIVAEVVGETGIYTSAKQYMVILRANVKTPKEDVEVRRHTHLRAKGATKEGLEQARGLLPGKNKEEQYVELYSRFAYNTFLRDKLDLLEADISELVRTDPAIPAMENECKDLKAILEQGLVPVDLKAGGRISIAYSYEGSTYRESQIRKL